MSQKSKIVLTDKNRTDESLEAQHHVIIGTSGSGKTNFVKRHPFFTNSNRILAYDPEESFNQLPKYETIKGLTMALRKVKKYGNIHARFCPRVVDAAQFEAFCRLVFETGHALNPTTVIAEEVADVTRIGKASPYWGQLARKGRKYALRIMAVSQRAQEIDKTILNQARFKVIGLLSSESDAKYAADLMRLKPADFIDNLPHCGFWIRDKAATPKLAQLKFKTPAK